jgi:hypothetical protein
MKNVSNAAFVWIPANSTPSSRNNVWENCQMLKIKLNGKEIEVEEEKTILEVARENGIDIPTL